MGMPVLYTAYNRPMLFTTLFFDLDDTLYPPATGLWEAIGSRINLYMTERMGFPPEQAYQSGKNISGNSELRCADCKPTTMSIWTIT